MKKVKFYLVLSLTLLISNILYGAITASERSVLIDLYNSTGGDNWTNKSGWKTPPLDTDGFAMPGTEGVWYGITVAGDYVTEIDLETNNLNGSIPSELKNISNLTKLILGGNELSGTIPIEIGNLSKLKNLQLGWSNLSGVIPAEIFNLTNLTFLTLGGNNFSNINLKDFAKLKNLNFLNLKGSKITGSIPVEFFTLSNLESLWLSGNRLSGSIPAAIGNLNKLIFLDLSNNGFTGDMPPELFTLSNMRGLFIGWNGLSGTIPQAFGNLTNLVDIRLNSNNLTGNIPTEFGNLVKLESLQLDHNKLNGQIPNSLANLTKLSSPNVDIGYNCLYTNETSLKAWLNNIDPDWESHQNECGFTLTVRSSPDTGVPITISPSDSYGQGNGNTEFFRTYNPGTIVTLTAPGTNNGKNFVKWLIDGNNYTGNTLQVTMSSSHTAQAIYQSSTYTLDVRSSPTSGIGISVSPADENGNGNGTTNFERIYKAMTIVTLTAPTSFSGSNFIKWTVNGLDYSNKTIQLTMEGNQNAFVYYESSEPPAISVNRVSLNFGYITGSSHMPRETFTIYNSGGGTLNWGASTDIKDIGLNPTSGTNYGVVEVTINPVGLLPAKYGGVIYVTDPLVSNSPVEVEINLYVKKVANPPFGDFSTPLDGATVSSSIPVTGWALGDTGMVSVKIYREEGKNFVYIGDALFVEGARPDIENAYPDYPMNYKAGWGYMMLTNFLPNGGNGVFKIHAVAIDKEGRTTDLGTKSLTVDNASAVKPFGAIDTPGQGGSALGSKYINWGWVLTPLPNYIPTDGSTINVYVDGVNLGHPTYNIYRGDIADMFLDYSNSIGAAGYLSFDTTAYENGIHTIQWTVSDNAGNTDGIGSRYFTIENNGGTLSGTGLLGKPQDTPVISIDSLIALPMDYNAPVTIKKGFQAEQAIHSVFPGKNGITAITIKELEPLEIHFAKAAAEIDGYMAVGNRLKGLPVGSYLDGKGGIFYWQPGPGFVGEYDIVFVEKKPNGDMSMINISVEILPKFEKK